MLIMYDDRSIGHFWSLRSRWQFDLRWERKRQFYWTRKDAERKYTRERQWQFYRIWGWTRV